MGLPSTKFGATRSPSSSHCDTNRVPVIASHMTGSHNAGLAPGSRSTSRRNSHRMPARVRRVAIAGDMAVSSRFAVRAGARGDTPAR